VPEKDEAWSTNYDLCRVSVTNTSPKWECLTKDNKAADGSPRFSASGKKLAWRAQKKAGYEADKWDILVADCAEDGTVKGKPFNVTAKFDVSVDEFIWNGSYDRAFFFTADYRGRTPVFMVQVEGTNFHIDHDGGQCGSLSASLQRNMLAYTEAALDRP